MTDRSSGHRNGEPPHPPSVPFTADRQAQIRSACERAARLIAENDRHLGETRLLLKRLRSETSGLRGPRGR
jgi:hypothetical protein